MDLTGTVPFLVGCDDGEDSPRAEHHRHRLRPLPPTARRPHHPPAARTFSATSFVTAIALMGRSPPGHLAVSGRTNAEKDIMSRAGQDPRQSPPESPGRTRRAGPAGPSP